MSCQDLLSVRSRAWDTAGNPSAEREGLKGSACLFSLEIRGLDPGRPHTSLQPGP